MKQKKSGLAGLFLSSNFYNIDFSIFFEVSRNPLSRYFFISILTLTCSPYPNGISYILVYKKTIAKQAIRHLLHSNRDSLF